jgi:hypothetical protein
MIKSINVNKPLKLFGGCIYNPTSIQETPTQDCPATKQQLSRFIKFMDFIMQQRSAAFVECNSNNFNKL